MLLQPGISFNHLSVVNLIGEGKQGEVYKVNRQGQEFALKWYCSQSATSQQKSQLEMLISAGKPCDNFIWPTEILQTSNGFGYLMPLLNPTCQPLSTILNNLTLQSSVKVALQVADLFLKLHANKGMYHGDISWNNIYVDTRNDEVFIVDNDSCAFNRQPATICGTENFMAPELVCRKAQPTISTDEHSLAVILFYIFFSEHPLKGQSVYGVVDEESMEKWQGTDPVYIFHPTNKSNRPDPNSPALFFSYPDPNSPALFFSYPASLMNLFERAFTTGLHNPSERVKDGEWKAVIASLNQSVVTPIAAVIASLNQSVVTPIAVPPKTSKPKPKLFGAVEIQPKAYKIKRMLPRGDFNRKAVVDGPFTLDEIKNLLERGELLPTESSDLIKMGEHWFQVATVLAASNPLELDLSLITQLVPPMLVVCQACKEEIERPIPDTDESIVVSCPFCQNKFHTWRPYRRAYQGKISSDGKTERLYQTCVQ